MVRGDPVGAPLSIPSFAAARAGGTPVIRIEVAGGLRVSARPIDCLDSQVIVQLGVGDPLRAPPGGAAHGGPK